MTTRPKALVQKKYWEVLWKHFRNGIAHGFAVSHGGLEGDGIGTYFSVKTIAGHQCLVINEYNLLQDLNQATKAYIDDLKRASSTSQIRQRFDAVFQDVFINGN